MVAGLRDRWYNFARSFCYENFARRGDGKESEREHKKVDYAGPAGSSTRNVGNAKEGEVRRIQRKQFHCASVGILSIALANVELYRKYYYFGSLSLRIFVILLVTCTTKNCLLYLRLLIVFSKFLTAYLIRLDIVTRKSRAFVLFIAKMSSKPY